MTCAFGFTPNMKKKKLLPQTPPLDPATVHTDPARTPAASPLYLYGACYSLWTFPSSQARAHLLDLNSRRHFFFASPSSAVLFLGPAVLVLVLSHGVIPILLSDRPTDRPNKLSERSPTPPNLPAHLAPSS
ncbi:hypothetical protein BS50DRAFT_578658 [Corynespora cassiicola Philippines]|uniref:Uncharacterized protein n=1 Tax=Corynespora cassiicola Philippines TaxID=1448308 RepID=A0A2T2N791_CORCC|nr:hypothetical protein BS50DRAFT_578658 [Corynespora cassiicola Philippines]